MNNISTFSGATNQISELSDKPLVTDGLTAAQLKARFDAAATLIKSYINATLVVAINALVDASHAHDNKSTLDTYTQTETNLADAVSKKHSHANAAVLDDLTADVATNSHTHGNKTTLDTYTQTEENLADAVSKKHSHANAAVLDGISSGNLVSSDSQSFAGAKTLTGKLTLGDMLVLSSDCFGTTLPTDDYTAGRIFFKKV